MSIISLASDFNIYASLFGAKERVEIVENLKAFLQENPNAVSDIDAVEEEAFSQYNDSDYIMSSSDFLEDLDKPKSCGVGLVKTNDKGDKKLIGYITGYPLIEDYPDMNSYIEEFQEIENDIVWHVSENESRNIIREIKSNGASVLYISDLAAIDKAPAFAIFGAIKKFLEQARSNGFKYVSAEALSGSYNLFMSAVGPKIKVLNRFGLKLLFETKEDNLVLFSI